MDLIRELLLRFEQTEDTRLSRDKLYLEGYSKEQVDFHVDLMTEAELLDHHIVVTPFSTRFDMGFRPTMAGYEFIDTIRDPEVWRKTKEGANKIGGWTIGLVKDLGTAYLKHLAKEKLGVDIG